MTPFPDLVAVVGVGQLGGELDNAAGPADSEQAAEPETVVADAAGDETS